MKRSFHHNRNRSLHSRYTVYKSITERCVCSRIDRERELVKAQPKATTDALHRAVSLNSLNIISARPQRSRLLFHPTRLYVTLLCDEISYSLRDIYTFSLSLVILMFVLFQRCDTLCLANYAALKGDIY